MNLRPYPTRQTATTLLLHTSRQARLHLVDQTRPFSFDVDFLESLGSSSQNAYFFFDCWGRSWKSVLSEECSLTPVVPQVRYLLLRIYSFPFYAADGGIYQHHDVEIFLIECCRSILSDQGWVVRLCWMLSTLSSLVSVYEHMEISVVPLSCFSLPP